MQRSTHSSRRSLVLGTPALVTGLALAQPAAAADALDTGDTAWILVSTALVLFMTIGRPSRWGGSSAFSSAQSSLRSSTPRSSHT